MYNRKVFSLVVGLPAFVAAVALPSALDHTVVNKRQTPDNSCVTGLHIIAVPGFGDGAGNYGYIGGLVNAITTKVPNSNSWLAGPYDTSDFVTGTAGVETQIRQHLADYAASCPATKVAVVGISAGGVTTMNVICGGKAPPWPATTAAVSQFPIVAAIAYGDPTFAAGQPFNAADCQANAPNGYRTDFSGCSSFFSNMQNYCHAADPVCCTGGTDANSHVTYDAEYDDQASTFVANVYAASIVAL